MNFVNPQIQRYEPLEGSKGILKQYLVYVSDVHTQILINITDEDDWRNDNGMLYLARIKIPPPYLFLSCL